MELMGPYAIGASGVFVRAATVVVDSGAGPGLLAGFGSRFGAGSFFQAGGNRCSGRRQDDGKATVSSTGTGKSSVAIGKGSAGLSLSIGDPAITAAIAAKCNSSVAARARNEDVDISCRGILTACC
jgi:hypothetical protein